MTEPIDDTAAGEAPAPPVADRIGPYVLGRRIGSGGLGTVYEAHGPHGRVALKVLHRETTGKVEHDDVAWRRRRSALGVEVETARRAAGPGVVRIVDVDVEHEPPYLAMEFVDSPNLYERRRADGPLSGERLERFANSLLTAMSHIHLVGIVHGDLKPTNVLVANDGTAHFVDFGLAAAATTDPSTGTGRGTPGWRAPEVEQGGSPTIASDVYGWGRVVDYAAASMAPPTLSAKIDAALSPDLARRRAVYVPPGFPIPDSEPSIPDTVPPASPESPAASAGQASPPSGHPDADRRASQRDRSARVAQRRQRQRRRGMAKLWLLASGLMLVGLTGATVRQLFSDQAPRSSTSPNDLVVFDESFRNGFSLNEFNGINDPLATAETHSGSISLATTPTAFDGFLVWVPDGEVLESMTELRLWILVADGDGGPLTVTAMRDLDRAAGPPIVLAGIVPGTWSEVVVSLDALIVDRGAYSVSTQRMLWFNSTLSTPRPTIYVDDIVLR